MLGKKGSARSVHEAKEAYKKARGALGYKLSSELAKKVIYQIMWPIQVKN